MKSSQAKPARREVDCASSPAIEICADLKLPALELTEIYRYLGYPRGTLPGSRIAARVQQVVEESQSYLEPRGTFSVHRVKKREQGSLQLGGVTIRGEIGAFMAQADRIAAFVVTVGKNVSIRATSARMGGDAFAALVFDAVGSWAVEAATDALMDRIERHLRPAEALTLRYSPGYCGMEISEQQKLFRLLKAQSVGVSLLPSMMMQPLKSISGLVGLGPAEAIIRYRSVCDKCPQVGCHMRR